MNIFNQIKQFLISLVDGKPYDTNKNMSDVPDRLEERSAANAARRSFIPHKGSAGKVTDS